MSRKGFLALIFFISAPVAVAQYVVKSGDTVGSIAKSFKGDSPLWGKDGFADKVARNNHLKDKDLIFPGMELVIPDHEVAAVKAQSQRAPAALPGVAPASVPVAAPACPAPAETPVEAEAARALATIATPAEDGDERPAILQASLGGGFLSRDLTDTTTNTAGTLKSKGVYGIGLSSLFPFSEESDVEVGVNYRSITFLRSVNRSVTQDQKGFLRMRLGWQWHLGQWSVGGGLQHEQMPLLTGVSVSAVALSSFTVLSPYLRGIWGFKRWKKTSADLAFTAFWHLPSDSSPYKLERGWSANLQMPVSRMVSPVFSYGFTPYAEYGKRKTNTVEHDDLEAGVSADLIWRM